MSDDESLVITANPTDRARKLAKLMDDNRVGSVVIVNDDNEPVGMVTDRDLALKVVRPAADPNEVLARDIMNQHVVTVESGAGTEAIVRKMTQSGVRRIPIVEDGKLVDIVTLDDVMRVIAGQQVRLAEIIEGESPDFLDNE